MSERVAIIAGVRTPFCKAHGAFDDLGADDLGAFVVSEVIARSGLKPEEFDELIFGNVLQPANATNIARVLSVKGGLPVNVPAYTVNRNCASGMEAIVAAVRKIRAQDGQTYLVGGTESMSGFPILFGKKMKNLFLKFSKARSFKEKMSLALSFRPSFLAPDVPKISDPLCSLTMGQTAEVLVRDFKITRREQDIFGLNSQKKASKALQEGIFAQEIIPIPLPPHYEQMQEDDDGIREGQTLEDFSKLKPVFDKYTGTVTAGTSSQVTDGAVAIVLMSESRAKSLGLKPIGYISDYSYAALDPRRMGLGPAYAISKILKKSGKKLEDFDLIEINEAFAAQVLAVERALASDQFAREHLGRERALGHIDPEKLNVNGGAIALGHPLGASGARLVLTLVNELNRRGKHLGLASLCVGGGQGEAVIVEAAR